MAKTDGVPLFVEELTKMVLESGLVREADGRYELTSPLPPLAIPATLQDSLMARLDRLAAVREVVQIGATLGREFPYELLQAVWPVDETGLQQALAKLVEAEVLYQRGLPPQARYLFKHALIQDAAYQSLLKSRRQQYHQQIAQVLEERFPETAETQPELLAHHYTEAGLAHRLFRTGSEQARGPSSTRPTSRRSVTSPRGWRCSRLYRIRPRAANTNSRYKSLWGASHRDQGWGAPDVGQAYTRALELCQQVGEPLSSSRVLQGLWVFYIVRAECKTARDLGEQLLSLAQSVQDPALLVEACFALGSAFYSLGELAPARAHLEQGIALYDPQQHHALAFAYGSFDPGVAVPILCGYGPVVSGLSGPSLGEKR